MTKKELRDQMEVLLRARKAKLVKKYQELAKGVRAEWEAANPDKANAMKAYAEAMKNVEHLNALMRDQCSKVIPGHRLCSPIDVYRASWAFTDYPCNEELKKIAEEFKQEGHNIDHEFSKLREIIASVPPGKAFKILIAAGLPFTENKIANLVALQPVQLNKSLIVGEE